MKHKHGHQVYVVAWRDERIVKAGSTSGRKRWRGFVNRGAELISLTECVTIDDCLKYEGQLRTYLASVGEHAFSTRIEGLPYLGGGGYLECFRIPDMRLLRALPAHAPSIMQDSA